MARLAALLLPLLLALTVVVLSRCSGAQSGPFDVETVAIDGEPSDEGYVPTLEGPLRPISATPNGAMAAFVPDQAVAVTFSQPMVPLGDNPDVPEDALRLEPAVPGRLDWQGTQTLVFHPEAPLPPATAFRATLRAGLTALSGDRLEKAYAWTFETPRPLLVHATPAAGEAYADPAQPFLLRFNQAVRPSERHVRLVEGGDAEGRSAPVQVTAQGDSLLRVAPGGRLKAGQAYTLLLLPGLPSAAGPLGMADTTRIAFETYGPLRLVKATQPRAYWEDESDLLNPERGLTLVFSTPVRFGDLRRALSFEPALTLPAGIEAQDAVVSAEHTLPLPLRPETAYTATVRGLTDAFGQRLDRGQVTFRTSALPPSVRMPEGLLVVEADARAGLPLRVTNVERVQLGARRLRQDQIVPLLRAYDREHYYGSMEEGEDEPRPVAASRTLPLRAPRNTPTFLSLSLDTLLSGGTGVVGVRMQGPALPGEDRPQDALALAQFTRLGLTAKFSPHQNLIVVTSLHTAEPVAGAAVTIRDQHNRVRWQGRTDAQGRALAPGWAPLGMTPPSPWEAPIQFAFAEHGGDLAFTSSLYNDGVEAYRFDVPYDWSPEAETFAGSIFTDRGLYKAGEGLHLKGIVRRRTDKDWLSVRDSLRVLVRSPRDQLVLDRRLLPSDLGTFSLDWTVPPTADQGSYAVRVVLAADTAALGREPWERGDVAQGSFRVDAFRRATFDVAARTAQPGFVAGDFFEGTIEGRYLFGADMAGQPVTYSLERRPGAYTPPGYDRYRFGVFEDDYHYDELARADTVLGEGGLVRLRRLLPGNPLGTPAELVWTGIVTDPARQEGTGQRVLPLHPGLFYLGLKPRSTFMDLSRDRRMAVDLVAVDPGGRAVGEQAVEVALVREQWNSVREVGTDGILRWKSERTEETLATQRVTTVAGKALRLHMPVEEGGSYLVRVSGRDVRGNLVRSEAYFYATGAGYVAWQRDDDDRIELIADKNTYAPGETARILVASPYEEARALITVEREGILSSRIETLRGSAPQLEIPLTDEHLPNAFVSVVLLSGRTAAPGAAADPGAPSFKIGYVNLPVDAGTRHLRVEVKPRQAQYRPGDEVDVELRLVDGRGRGVAGEIAFSAADAGVLNLIGYRLPDPFDAFYGPRALGVTTSETRASLVRQRNFGQKAEDQGGGGGDRAELLRKDFRPLAHWAPALRTDGSGRARVRFRLPESLTTFRLMAAAATADHRFGRGAADVVVTQPLVLQAALPRFARLDDAFEAGVLVTNTTGAAGEATVTAQAEGLTLDGPARLSVRLGDGATREVRFRWKAARSGEARLRFEAALGRERDAFAVTLPVSLPTTKRVDAVFASTEAAAREAVQVPADRIPGLGRLEARLSATALVGLDGASRYLFTYPYGCLEQRTSRIRPLLLAEDLLQAFDLEALGGADRRALVEGWLATLPDYWVGGGFTMWLGGREANPYLTAYVVLALAEARAAGYAVPDALTARAVDALATQVRTQGARPSYFPAAAWNETRTLMLLALARHGRVLEPELNALAEASGTLTPEGEALLLRALVAAGRPALRRHVAPLTERLRARVVVEPTGAYLTTPVGDAYAWIFASDTRATAFGLTALVEAAPGGDTQALAERMVQSLMASRTEGAWPSTQDNAAVIDAFRTYYLAYERQTPAFTAAVQAAGRALVEGRFEGRSLRVAEGTLPLAGLPTGTPLALQISKAGAGRLYYALRLETYTNAPQDALAQGLVVERRLQRLDDRGQPVGEALTTGNRTVTLPPGALVRVTLRLSSPTDRGYVVVDDALPAGLEALNAAFETTNQALLEGTGQSRWWGSFNHTEIRDDRVLLFADYLLRGEHTYTYVARATTPGTFVHPPARAEAMYQPEVNGRTATGRLVVQTPEEVARR